WCSVFFQAEDGIRDRNVTGVQTCALPIYVVAARFARPGVDLAYAGEAGHVEYRRDGRAHVERGRRRVDETAEVVGARGRVEVGRLVHMRCMLSTRAGAETSDPVIALLSLVSWS